MKSSQRHLHWICNDSEVRICETKYRYSCVALVNNRDQVQKRLKEVEKALADAQARIPAHSVKPAIMQQLFALEEERERLLEQLADDEPQGS